MLKGLCVILCFCGLFGAGFSQTASPETIGNGGGSVMMGGFQIDYNIGDLAIQTAGTGPVITQGFEQPEMGDISLPVLGLSLKVSNENNYAHLYFSTVQEFKTDHFLVERSTDGQHFDTLTIIQTKAPKGYSTAPLYYNYSDLQMVRSVYYYRIAEVDQNGAVTYSSVESVNNLSGTAPNGLKIFPNPVTTQLQVQLGSYQGIATLRVYSLSGTLLLTRVLSGQSETTIQTGTLNPGVYLLTAEANGSILTTKFIKK